MAAQPMLHQLNIHLYNSFNLLFMRYFKKMLQGYLAGNPCTDKQYDMDGRIKFFHGMGLTSDEMFEVITSSNVVLIYV